MNRWLAAGSAPLQPPVPHIYSPTRATIVLDDHDFFYIRLMAVC